MGPKLDGLLRLEQRDLLHKGDIACSTPYTPSGLGLDAAPTELPRNFPTRGYKYFAPTEQRVHPWPAPEELNLYS